MTDRPDTLELEKLRGEDLDRLRRLAVKAVRRHLGIDCTFFEGDEDWTRQLVIDPPENWRLHARVGFVKTHTERPWRWKVCAWIVPGPEAEPEPTTPLAEGETHSPEAALANAVGALTAKEVSVRIDELKIMDPTPRAD